MQRRRAELFISCLIAALALASCSDGGLELSSASLRSSSVYEVGEDGLPSLSSRVLELSYTPSASGDCFFSLEGTGGLVWEGSGAWAELGITDGARFAEGEYALTVTSSDGSEATSTLVFQEDEEASPAYFGSDGRLVSESEATVVVDGGEMTLAPGDQAPEGASSVTVRVRDNYGNTLSAIQNL